MEHILNTTKKTQILYNMEIKVIKTEKDYQMALRRLDAIFDAHLDSQNADELEMLSLLIDKYEEEKFPIDLL